MQKILDNIKAKQFAPIYLFHGEESYFIDLLADAIEQNVLEAHQKAFNEQIFYGKEVTSSQVRDACVQFPMMSPKRLVILREAQALRSIGELHNYAEKPVMTTVLVILYKHKKLDGKTKLAKALKKHAVVFESKKLYDNQIPKYLVTYVKSKNRRIDDAAAMLLSEYIGSDLSLLHQALDRLFLISREQPSITATMVEKQIGVSKDYNVFELQKALADKDAKKIFSIAQYFVENPKNHNIIMVIGNLYRFFTKVWIVAQNSSVPDAQLGRRVGIYNNYFMKDYRIAARNYSLQQIENTLCILSEYDLKSKGVGVTGAMTSRLLLEMVAKILL